jgi:hypothetical protein
VWNQGSVIKWDQTTQPNGTKNVLLSRLQFEIKQSQDETLDPYKRLLANYRAERLQDEIDLRDSTFDWSY